MGFNSAFKGLKNVRKPCITYNTKCCCQSYST